MSEHVIGAHNGLHSGRGALAHSIPGRSGNPGHQGPRRRLSWGCEKPDLARAEAFAAALRLHYRAAHRRSGAPPARRRPGAPCSSARGARQLCGKFR